MANPVSSGTVTGTIIPAGKPYAGKMVGKYLNGTVPYTAPPTPAATWTAYAGELAGRGAGWTALPLQSGNKIIYVSDSGGLDSNDGLTTSTPKKTFASALAICNASDHIYLKRGDTWNVPDAGEYPGILNLPTGTSSTYPTVVGFYGTSGARPELIASTTILNTYNDGISNIAIVGVHFKADPMDPFSEKFLAGEKDDHVSFAIRYLSHNWTLEDCFFEYIEIVSEAKSINDVSYGPDNLTIRRCIFNGSYSSITSFNNGSRPSNIFIAGTQGFLAEDNVFDYGGWHPEVLGAGANQFNHNCYIQYSASDVVMRNNIVTRASSHGIHGRPGGLYENNFFARNSIGQQIGYNGHPLPADRVAEVRDSVITEGWTMNKGHKACYVNGICTPAVWGLVANEQGSGTFIMTNNIVHTTYNPTADPDWDWVARSTYSEAKSLQDPLDTDTNNILWHWNNSTQGDGPNYVDPGRTLGKYYAHITGQTASFDAAMQHILTRPVGAWSTTWTATAINDWIRAGFAVV